MAFHSYASYNESVDFSMLALFLRADLVVKSVILILILSSIYSWNIIIAKILRMRQLQQMEKEFDQQLNLGLKLVHFDENDQELEPEYFQMTYFALTGEEKKHSV